MFIYYKINGHTKWNDIKIDSLKEQARFFYVENIYKWEKMKKNIKKTKANIKPR